MAGDDDVYAFRLGQEPTDKLNARLRRQKLVYTFPKKAATIARLRKYEGLTTKRKTLTKYNSAAVLTAKRFIRKSILQGVRDFNVRCLGHCKYFHGDWESMPHHMEDKLFGKLLKKIAMQHSFRVEHYESMPSGYHLILMQ